MAKKVIISGITGQDGSYMAEYLLNNTENLVVGGIRRTSQAILSNLKNVINNPRFKLVTVDLCDGEAVRGLIRDEKPDYFINLGAQTFVADSWKNPVAHMMTNAISIIYILEAIREYNRFCRFYSAGSSEQFGDVKYSPQDISHPMSPRSVYGVSKCAASHLVKVYRETYGLYAVHGVLFNHESERRQEYFVTRKITKAVARIKKALDAGTSFEPLKLGNVNALRDWSHAEDFVDGIWRMLNQVQYEVETMRAKGYLIDYEPNPPPKDYILSSNETHSVREFVEKAFAAAGINGQWLTPTGNPLDEKFVLTPSIDRGNIREIPYVVLVEISSEFYRPADVELLHGDSTAARTVLGWMPKVSFEQLVERMVKHDLNES